MTRRNLVAFSDHVEKVKYDGGDSSVILGFAFLHMDHDGVIHCYPNY